MTADTILTQLARFATDATFDGLPREIVHGVEQHTLDTLGVALAASAQGTADGVADLVRDAAGRKQASLIGRGGRYPVALAALHNGTLAHSLDFDDTHLPSVLHPSASIVPAALALAESAHTRGDALVVAIAIGLEVTVRTGMGGYLAAEGNVFFERGWHATSICGTLGAAATAAKLLGFDAERMADAIGIATSMSSGVIEANRVGGTVKRLHCGWAAHAGILAAQLAGRGYTAPASAFEGRFGFYRAFLDGHYDPAAVVDGLGQRWEIPAIHFKPYPANHYTHAAIDAALAVRARRAVDPNEIVGIDLGSSEPALRTIGEPREEKIRPRSGYHAKFSAPFVVAAALLGGGGLGVDFSDFTDERAHDPRYLELAAKVSTFVDPECDAVFPNAFAGVLRVHLRDGSTIEERVMQNRGGPQRPLSDHELRQKFASNARGALSDEAAERIPDSIFGLADANDVSDLAAQLSRRDATPSSATSHGA